ncbi:MAG: DUF4349 domain-containing protein [Solobacterium sp.]|nr:DUF4349 domain-containing protein [Solobacterium sp.]
MKKTVCLIALCLLCGCGGKGAAEAYDTGNYAASPAAIAAEDAKTPAYDGTSSSLLDENTVTTTEKLVYTGSVTVETLAYEECVSAVKELITSFNGMIEYENINDYDYSWYNGSDRRGTRQLECTVRIPSEKYFAFLDGLEGTGKVKNRSSSTENISRRYADNQVHIEALEKQQERLLAMMDEAKTISEMIEVEARLSEVETELNRYKTYREQMDTDVALSTVHLYINEVERYTPVRISFIEHLQQSFMAGWNGFVEFWQDFLIFIAERWPFVILFVLIAVLAVRLGKRQKKAKLNFRLFKRKNKEDETPQP